MEEWKEYKIGEISRAVQRIVFHDQLLKWNYLIKQS